MFHVKHCFKNFLIIFSRNNSLSFRKLFCDYIYENDHFIVSRETLTFEINHIGEGRHSLFCCQVEFFHSESGDGLCNHCFNCKRDGSVSGPVIKEAIERCHRDLSHADPCANYCQDHGHQQHAAHCIYQHNNIKAVAFF